MTVTIHVGDCRQTLATLPAGSVQTVITSPPYWGLRDYGLPPLVWDDPEGEPCIHAWIDASYTPSDHKDDGATSSTLQGGKATQAQTQRGPIEQAFCAQCGAWRGSLGLEPSPDLYVAHLVDIFREVRRVLRDDGTVWLNLGDSYAGSWGNSGRRPELDGTPSYQRDKNTEYFNRGGWDQRRERPPASHNLPGLKPKDLCGIPWRVAFALQADGWWLRSDIIWHKPNPMPESVRDRPTKAHEYVFLLSKSARYFYDADAIREESVDPEGSKSRYKYDFTGRPGLIMPDGDKQRIAPEGKREWKNGRNRRTVWTIATQPFSEAHFATFPPDLVEPCMLAGTSQKGSCPECGAPCKRNVKRTFLPQKDVCQANGIRGHTQQKQMDPTNGWQDTPRGTTQTHTLAWSPTCTCGAPNPAPCTVLDPFGGAGTVGLVASRLGRHAILCELNPDYAHIARQRIIDDAPLTNQVDVIPANAGIQEHHGH